MVTRAALAEALAQKAVTIERCVARAREERAAATDFATDFTRQDAALMNVQRACDAAIDMANMAIAHEGWGVPNAAADAFALLHERGVAQAAVANALQGMVGFRNIAVHAYRKLNLDIVDNVIAHELDTLAGFAGILLARYDR